MDYLIDNNIIKAIKILKDNGYEAYIVGGAIRDLILDLPISDYDIASNISLENAYVLFKEYSPKLYSNGITMGAVINHTHFELSSYKGKTIEEDLYERDFSINSIAYDIDNGLTDPYNGIYDLSKNILKTVKNPIDVIKKDPVRILRALRFISRGFIVDDNLYKVMNEYAYLLKDIKRERIRKELDFILLSKNPSVILSKYKSILKEIIPSIDNIINFGIIDIIRNDLAYRLTAFCYLLHDDIYNLLKGLYYPISLINQVIHVTDFMDYSLGLNKEQILTFLFEFGLDDIEIYFALKRAEKLANNEEIYDIDSITTIARGLMLDGKIVTKKNLKIKANDLRYLGYKEEDIDKALNIIIKKVVHNELPNVRKVLFDYACRLKYDI